MKLKNILYSMMMGTAVLTGTTSGVTDLSWDANDAWVSDMYYRIYYNIALCNDFLRNANNSNFSGADA